MNDRVRHDGIGMTSRRTRVRLIEHLRAEGIRDEAVLEAMLETPRHLFVDEALATRAYEDTALPIGFGQTISTPSVVARMTEALCAGGTLGRVLEIGTGSGYQTAILARLAGEVCTIERIDDLLVRARRRFRSMGLRNVYARHGDGKAGWPGNAPYDGIIAAASPAEVPPAFLEQLAPGGRLVMPVGAGGSQELQRITRTREGFELEVLQPVSFVPMLTGDR